MVRGQMKRRHCVLEIAVLGISVLFYPRPRVSKRVEELKCIALRYVLHVSVYVSCVSLRDGNCGVAVM